MTLGSTGSCFNQQSFENNSLVNKEVVLPYLSWSEKLFYSEAPQAQLIGCCNSLFLSALKERKLHRESPCLRLVE